MFVIVLSRLKKSSNKVKLKLVNIKIILESGGKNMNENNKPRRSIFSIILPYLLMAIAIGAFIAIVVSMNTGNATVWYASTIDTALAENEIKTADVYDKQTVVTVEGIYVSGADNKERRYTFTCSSEQFNYAFDSNGDANNDHAAYRTLFLQEIEQYKVAHI